MMAAKKTKLPNSMGIERGKAAGAGDELAVLDEQLVGHRNDVAITTIALSRPAPDTFHIDVWRSFSAYAWQLLDEARGELA
jgi:hypothetical protein